MTYLYPKQSKKLLSYTQSWYKYDESVKYNCPAKGSFIAWKGAIILYDPYYIGSNVMVEYCLVKLKIPADSPRLRAKNSKKCRCKFAEVLDIQRRDGSSFSDDTVAYSLHEVNTSSIYKPEPYKTRYKKGEKVYADSFDDDKENECSHGIHFFMRREDAMAYIGL